MFPFPVSFKFADVVDVRQAIGAVVFANVCLVFLHDLVADFQSGKRAMNGAVFRSRHECEVLDAVVEAVSVDMVDDDVLRQRNAEVTRPPFVRDLSVYQSKAVAIISESVYEHLSAFKMGRGAARIRVAFA